MARPLNDMERGQVYGATASLKALDNDISWAAQNCPALGTSKRIASALSHIRSARLALLELLTEGVSERRAKKEASES